MKIAIAGTGGHAQSVAEVAEAVGYQIDFYIDPFSNAIEIDGVPVVTNERDIKKYSKLNITVAIGNNKLRREVVLRLKNFNPSLVFPNLVHPSSIISNSCSLGEGVIVHPLSHLGAKSLIGDHAIINSCVTIEHNSALGNFVSIAPGVIGGGNVRIGNYSQICLGSKIIDNVEVGENSILGANSLLNRNLPSNVVAYGTPARVIRSNDD